MVKLWAFDGDELGSFAGHKAFVFAVDCIAFGHYVSGGDDKTIKIWKDG
jgi:phospholipase A-2-activating protein